MENVELVAKKRFDWRLLVPFGLTALLLIADQVTKALVVANVPYHGPHSPTTVYASLWDGFLQIIHTRNSAIALSIGVDASETFKLIFFKFLALIVLSGVVVYYFLGKDLNWYRRWTLAGILGGGFGNLIDRFFRPDGVVDFIDVRFFGLFGLERFPTFNVADASISVCAVLLFLSLLFGRKPKHESQG